MKFSMNLTWGAAIKRFTKKLPEINQRAANNAKRIINHLTALRSMRIYFVSSAWAVFVIFVAHTPRTAVFKMKQVVDFVEMQLYDCCICFCMVLSSLLDCLTMSWHLLASKFFYFVKLVAFNLPQSHNIIFFSSNNWIILHTWSDFIAQFWYYAAHLFSLRTSFLTYESVCSFGHITYCNCLIFAAAAADVEIIAWAAHKILCNAAFAITCNLWATQLNIWVKFQCQHITLQI